MAAVDLSVYSRFFYGRRRENEIVKFEKTYLNIDYIEMICHSSGNVIEGVMTDGKRVYGNKPEQDRLDIMEKVNNWKPGSEENS